MAGRRARRAISAPSRHLNASQDTLSSWIPAAPLPALARYDRRNCNCDALHVRRSMTSTAGSLGRHFAHGQGFGFGHLHRNECGAAVWPDRHAAMPASWHKTCCSLTTWMWTSARSAQDVPQGRLQLWSVFWPGPVGPPPHRNRNKLASVHIPVTLDDIATTPLRHRFAPHHQCGCAARAIWLDAESPHGALRPPINGDPFLNGLLINFSKTVLRRHQQMDNPKCWSCPDINEPQCRPQPMRGKPGLPQQMPG